MIRKTLLATAAALVLGSASAALAAPLDYDANTGLPTGIYYDTISNLKKQNLPVRDHAQVQPQQHRAYGFVGEAPVAQNGDQVNFEKQSGPGLW